MTTTLLGLHGRRGSGKDTAFGFAHQWAADRGLLARRRGFADALKLSFARMFLPDCSVDEAVNWCDEIKFIGDLRVSWQRGDPAVETLTTIAHNISGRIALQRYGTEGHRDVFGDDFWVDALLPTSTIINEHDLPEGPRWPYNFMGQLDQGNPDLCVITDVRFENEAQRIKMLGGHVWTIDRPETDLGDQHRSEAGLPEDLVDRVVYNDDTIERFRGEVIRHLSELLPPENQYDKLGERGEL